MSRTDPQFKLRIPAALKEQLEAAALQASRSTTAEILHRLELSFDPNAAATDDPAQQVFAIMALSQHVQRRLDALEHLSNPSPEQLADLGRHRELLSKLDRRFVAMTEAYWARSGLLTVEEAGAAHDAGKSGAQFQDHIEDFLRKSGMLAEPFEIAAVDSKRKRGG